MIVVKSPFWRRILNKIRFRNTDIKVPVGHQWRKAFSQFTSDHKQVDICYQCTFCGVFKHEYKSVEVDEMDEAHKSMEEEAMNDVDHESRVVE